MNPMIASSIKDMSENLEKIHQENGSVYVGTDPLDDAL